MHKFYLKGKKVAKVVDEFCVEYGKVIPYAQRFPRIVEGCEKNLNSGIFSDAIEAECVCFQFRYQYGDDGGDSESGSHYFPKYDGMYECYDPGSDNIRFFWIRGDEVGVGDDETKAFECLLNEPLKISPVTGDPGQYWVYQYDYVCREDE